MATVFLEPGGDATFNAQTTSNGGLWTNQGGNPTVATDFVHGGHKKSIKYAANSADKVVGPATANAGTRISIYIYLVALPTATTNIFGSQSFITVALTSAGVFQVRNLVGSQIGSSGTITLSTGRWYRLCLAYTWTSSSVNEVRTYIDGVPDISISNASITNTSGNMFVANLEGDATLDFRSSDHYVDNNSSLTDTGNIWVTAKRPYSNGTLNEWTTQVGSGGSGYGSGHSPQVNERPVSTTNGWSFQDTVLRTEEYTIESKSQGDIDISAQTIVDSMGWVYTTVSSNSTGNIIVSGTASNISVTTSDGVFTKIVGSSTYPAGNTDIGMNTNTVNQLFKLYDCGVVVAYIPRSPSITF